MARKLLGKIPAGDHMGDWVAVIDGDTELGPSKTKREAFSLAAEHIDLGLS